MSEPQPLPAPAPLSPQDERTWAMLAHLSVLANLFSGLLGPVVALAIYLAFKERSHYVGFQSLQAFVFQLVGWLGGGFLAAMSWAITGVTSVFLVGLLCIPLAALVTLIPLGAVVYGVVGGVQCSQGNDFRYWLVGEWVRR